MQHSQPLPASQTAMDSDLNLRKSCQHCRKRKIKCLAIPGSTACKACTAKSQPCVYEKQSQMGRPPKSKSTAPANRTHEPSAACSSSSSSQAGSSSSRKRRSSAVPSAGPDGQSSTKKTRLQESGQVYSTSDQQHNPILTSMSSLSSSTHQPLLWQTGLPDTYTATFANHIPPSALSQSLPLAASSPYVSSHATFPTANPASSSMATLYVQTEKDPLPFFRNQPLLALAAAFHHILSSSSAHLSQDPTPVLSDPRIAPMARIRTLAARATATRTPVDRGPNAATPTYARSLISPLWDGLPVDIIALTTTGKPSASGPFSISSEASKRSLAIPGPGSAHEEYLYVKLLREDESADFQVTNSAPSSAFQQSSLNKGSLFPKDSPGFRYAPDKTTVGKFFTGYFSKHPLAPLILNERIFLDDLMSNRVDPLLLHVIVGSSIARAPCLGAGTDDAEDIGDEFFRYIEGELLSRNLAGVMDLQTCQALTLWATHELTHMRVRRANALWSTVDVLLRQRVQAFQTRVEEEAAFNRMQQEGVDTFGKTAPIPMGWRDLVEQELTVNALWIIVVWNTWTSLSLKLPHNTMSIMAHNLPSPPQSVSLSSSFAFAYSDPNASSPLQPIVRRTIERFSDMTQLINVIVTLKNQKQAKSMFAPDPPRPLAVVDDEEAQIATWLVDLAKYYHTTENFDLDSTSAANYQLVSHNKLSDSSRSFLVASHAVLALHQILPYANASSTSYGSPLPLPTVDSLRTSLAALHMVARSIQVSAPGSRTRTQAILLDAMPRILSLLDIFTSSSLSSLDHFVLVTSQRDLVHELLNDLNHAIACMSSSSSRTVGLDNCGEALEKSSRGLRTVVDIGLELQSRQHSNTGLAQTSNAIPVGAFTSAGINPAGFSTFDSPIVKSAGVSSTPSTSSSPADGQQWNGGVQVNASWPQNGGALAMSSGSYHGTVAPRPDSYASDFLPHASNFFTGVSNTSQYGQQPEYFSMSSHLANSPLLRTHDRGVMGSPTFVGSLHAFL